nr:retrovirus-related Pol polyprotein from transposon TNT 1-94 [Tanacetum cinerariifolium]
MQFESKSWNHVRMELNATIAGVGYPIMAICGLDSARNYREVIQIKQRMQAARNRQQSYTDLKRLWYSKDSGFELTRFSNDDYAGCKDIFKITYGGAQFLGEKLVRWSSKKQDCTALSTAEAEYVSLSACSIAISCNPVQHSRTKHIAVRYHFIKEHVEKGTIELYFVKTDYQLADIFTKVLPADRFNYLVCRLGMRSLSPKELKRLAKS